MTLEEAQFCDTHSLKETTFKEVGTVLKNILNILENTAYQIIATDKSAKINLIIRITIG
jgi:hypothetical protein